MNATFVEWISVRGTWDLPPKSYDITPCDFSMCGIVKEHILKKPGNIEHLKFIESNFKYVNNNQKLILLICSSIEEFSWNTNGHHFENYR